MSGRSSLGNRALVTFRYINSAQVASYRRKGWMCSLMLGHHGAEGRWCNLLRGPFQAASGLFCSTLRD